MALVKIVIWDNTALEEVRSFSVEARQEIGALLRILQDGSQLGMPQSRPMRELAPSALEFRIKDRR